MGELLDFDAGRRRRAQRRTIPEQPVVVEAVVATGGYVAGECSEYVHHFQNGRHQPCQCGKEQWPEDDRTPSA